MQQFKIWLVFMISGRRIKIMRMTKNRPSLRGSEFAIQVNVNFPKEFKFPDIQVAMDMPVDAEIIMPELSAELDKEREA